MSLSLPIVQIKRSSQRSRRERVLDHEIRSRQPQVPAPFVIYTQTDDSPPRTSLALTPCSFPVISHISLEQRRSFLSILGPSLLGRE